MYKQVLFNVNSNNLKSLDYIKKIVIQIKGYLSLKIVFC